MPHISSSKISLSSLDPPNVKRDIPPLFKLTRRNLTTEVCLMSFGHISAADLSHSCQELVQMADIPLYDTLPRILIPSSKLSLKPPVMHYGWRVDIQKILKYAKDHDLNWEPVIEDVSSSDDATEEDDGEAAEDKGGKSRKVVFDPHPEAVPIAQYTLESVVRRLGLPYPEDVLYIDSALLRDDITIISLYTNYDLGKAPSDDVIEALRVELGETEKPKWYMDLNQVTWTRYGRRL
ncbi:hypothetical protein AcW1_003102 [Taiwanofungus camphoratus]|nr:hypothetical protein AcV5_001706 [Antrodia cinnamomea]KAI0942481.1 hypothetical protein AcW1_003102 [Antrodia cinnamomea]